MLEAIAYANDHAAHPVGFSGFDGGPLARIAPSSIVAPDHDMQSAEHVRAILFHAAMHAWRARVRASQTSSSP